MNLLHRIAFFCLFFLLFICAICWIVIKGYADTPLTHIAQNYLSTASIETKILGLKISGSAVHIDQIQIRSKYIDEFAIFENIESNIKTENILKNLLFNIDFSIEKFVIFNGNNISVIESNANGHFFYNLRAKEKNIALYLSSLQNNWLKDMYKDMGINNADINQDLAKAEFTFQENHKTELTLSKFNLFLSQNSNISAELEFNKNEKIAQIYINNIPLSIYKIGAYLFPEKAIWEELKNVGLSGTIRQGELKFLLDKKYQIKDLTTNNLVGNFFIENIYYRYDKDFIPITRGDLDIKIDGSLVKANIKKAYLGKTLLSDGELNFDFSQGSNSKIFVKSSAKGNPLDIVSFIPQKTLKELKKVKIDLTKFKGKAISDVKIEIPISDQPNIYDIKTKLSNLSIDILDKEISLVNGDIKGLFDGRIIKLIGTGTINNMDCSINYQYNMFDVKADEASQFLDIKTNPVTYDRKAFDLFSVSFLKGSNIWDLNYSRINNKNYIKIGSDLTDTNFKINAIAIDKPLSRKAFLFLEGELGDGFSNIIFSLKGDDKLNISGDAKIKDDNYVLDFKEIKYQNTDLIAHVIFANDNSLKLDISGKSFDLSSFPITDIIKDSEKKYYLNLKANVNTLYLKNNVRLRNILMSIDSTPKFLNEAIFQGNIGRRDLKMELKPNKDNDLVDRWVLYSGNAGALFRAFNIYENIKLGELKSNINIHRNDNGSVKKIDGDFLINRFYLLNNNFMTKMVSFVSLQGFLTMFSKQQEIAFQNIKGNFSHEQDITNLSKTIANGPMFGFTMEGNINHLSRLIDLKGVVTPSIYGITTLLRALPIFGEIIAGVKKGAILSTSYKIKEKF